MRVRTDYAQAKKNFPWRPATTTGIWNNREKTNPAAFAEAFLSSFRTHESPPQTNLQKTICLNFPKPRGGLKFNLSPPDRVYGVEVNQSRLFKRPYILNKSAALITISLFRGLGKVGVCFKKVFNGRA